MWVLWRLWNEKGEFPGERVKAADGWGGVGGEKPGEEPLGEKVTRFRREMHWHTAATWLGKTS